jgi:hypothetical protein
VAYGRLRGATEFDGDENKSEALAADDPRRTTLTTCLTSCGVESDCAFCASFDPPFCDLFPDGDWPCVLLDRTQNRLRHHWAARSAKLCTIPEPPDLLKCGPERVRAVEHKGLN